LKSVFIIAIVAVAMIGIMVPSGFSEYEPCKEPNMSNHPACAEVVDEKEAAEKAAAEKAAAEKIAEKNATAAKIAKERAAEKAAAEKIANTREKAEAAAEKAAAEKAVLTFAEKVAKAIEAEDKTEYTVHKWTPERNSDAYQTGVKKVSPEEAKQRMEEMFGGTGLPMPGSSEGLKHVIPTEKEMFDSRMLAEANSPKSSPAYEPPKAKQWWCFWC
jgi:hypothetical protein